MTRVRLMRGVARPIVVAALALLEVLVTSHAAAQPDDARSKQYPKDRDYASEFRELVMSRRANASLKASDVPVNLWQELTIEAAKISGILDVAVEQSPVFRPWAERTGGGQIEYDVRTALDEALDRNDLPPEVLEELRRVVRQIDDAVPLRITEFARQPHAIYAPTPPGGPLIAASKRELATFRQFARFGMFRATLALHDKDDAAFIRVVEEMLLAANVVEHDPSTLPRLVAHSIRVFAYRMVTRAVVAGEMSAPTRRDLSRLFRDPLPQSWRHSIEGERLTLLDAINHLYAELGPNTPGMARREDALARTDELFNELERTMNADPSVAKSASERMLRTIAELQDAKADAGLEPIAAVAPSFRRVVTLERAVRATRDGVATLLAVDAYRVKNGRPPESLAALVPEYLSEAPRDWLDPDRRELRYKLVDPAADRLKRSYLLYSVGADGKDHGGTSDPADPWRAMQQDTGEFDLVINVIELDPPRE